MRSSSTRVDSSRAPHLANGRPLGPWRSACGLLLTLAVRAALGQALTTARSLSMSTWTMAPGKSEAHARRRMLRTWWVVPCFFPHRRSQCHAHPVVRVSSPPPSCAEEELAHVAAQERRVWVPGHYAWPHACIRRRSLRHQAGAEGERGRRECPPAVQVCVGTSCNTRHARALCHCCVVGTSHRVACVLALRCMLT